MRWYLAASLGLLSAVATAAPSILTIPPETQFAMRVVVLHNQQRAVAGVGPVTWDPALAAAADAYAAQLARTRRWGHSPPAARPGQGENLWMGTRGAFSVDAMIGAWAGEGRMFRPGIFPTVSRTGSWGDVGHYTQMVWRGTARVGCAIRSSARDDYLVCRYAPAGNVVGVAVP